MSSRYSNLNSRRQRAHDHGTERSEFYDVRQIIARNKAQQKVRGTNRSQCARCGKYFTEQERELHFECPIFQHPKPKPKAPIAQSHLKLTPAKGKSKKKLERSHLPSPRIRLKMDGPISCLSITVVLISNGKTSHVSLGSWFCDASDEHLLYNDEELLKSLAIKLRHKHNPFQTAVVSVSACRKKTGDTYPLNSSRLAELFKLKETKRLAKQSI